MCGSVTDRECMSERKRELECRNELERERERDTLVSLHLGTKKYR